MPGKVYKLKFISRRDVKRYSDTHIFVFGDNMQRRGLGGQAKEMRGEPNVVGIPTKHAPSNSPTAYFTDADFDKVEIRDAIDGAFALLLKHLKSGKNLTFPADGIGTGLADLPRRAPKIYYYILGQQHLLEIMAGN